MNVYADLGTSDAEEMLVKAQLAAETAEIIKQKRLTQIQAAELLGIPQLKLSNMLRGRFRGISEVKMLKCLTRLGRDMQIVVKTSPQDRARFGLFCLTGNLHIKEIKLLTLLKKKQRK